MTGYLQSDCTADFVNDLRSMNVRPHVARNVTRCNGRSAMDGRTARHAGSAASQRIRKRIEESSGWIKIIAGLERPMVRGVDRVGRALNRPGFAGGSIS
ncbi:hypothetical protein KL771_02955 [Hyphomicrobiaceae bacterium 22]|uniref:Uncharacterized protein n=1 Tax=Prosthecodimorpha staleyi TaxID=2840188 RepID=A0A947GB80_9HYPH|nr:hypothetical protein [Prosthecodimorpha staleyi]